MHELEAGVLEDSEILFLIPSDFAQKYLFNLQALGKMHCDSRYYCTHTYWESVILLFIEEGTLNGSYRGQSFSGKPRDIVLIDCRYEHCWYTDEEIRMRFFHFSGPQAFIYSDLLLQMSGGPVLHQAESSILSHTLQNLFKLAQAGVSYQNEHRIATYIQMILTELVENGYGDNKRKGDSMVDRSIAFMKEHITENLSLDAMASHVGLSKHYFGKTFKRATGSTPHQYFTSLRLTYAGNLLMTTYSSIEEIANQCGFDSASNFIRLFRKHTGQTPSAFRQNTFGQ